MFRTMISLVFMLSLLASPAPAVELTPDGGGEYAVTRTTPCLTQEMREEIQQVIDANSARLEKEGKLLEYSSKLTLFEWPLQAAAHYQHYGYHGISGFVDQDPTAGTLDYSCGSTTYNGHQGTDYYLWPFSWNMMDNNDVEVISAARGVITAKYDGNYDRSCDWVTYPNWNAIYVKHADNSILWYGHLKTNSLTPKAVGDTVEVGEYLGLVGSSGISTAPHLHFELHNRAGALFDPYYDTCNSKNASSWWAAQRPYRDSAINALMTHTTPPSWASCPNPATINDSDIYDPGDPLVTAIYLRDELLGHVTVLKIYKPDNSVWQSWNHTMGATHYSSSWWYWDWTLPVNAPEGLWKFEAVYQGNTYEHSFVVGNVTSVADALPAGGRARLEQSMPNPFNPTTTIAYSLPEKSDVIVEIYSAGGSLVRRLVNAQGNAGRNEIIWDGVNEQGQEASSGLYFVRLLSGETTDMKKITLIR